jgi:glycopeptide antibiotics resistance protein
VDEGLLRGLSAVALGLLAGFVLFVPLVAISYRRRGGLTFGRFLLWTALLVYFMALWTYTLLPLPDPESLVCAGTNTDLLAFADEVDVALDRSGGDLRDPAILQLLLNVLLFVPLGFLLARGFPSWPGPAVWALCVLGSVGVEAIQAGFLPGRVPSVVDVAMNGLGAAVGVLLAFLFTRRAAAQSVRQQ